MFGDQAYSSSTNQTSVSTNTAIDAYNQSSSRIENLSDVGNIQLQVGDSKSSGGFNPIIAVVVGGVVLLYFYMKKKGKI